MVRVKKVWETWGSNKTQFYEGVNSGLITKPVKITARSAGLPDTEVEVLGAARLVGLAMDETRKLVDDLHAERAKLFARKKAAAFHEAAVDAPGEV